MVSRVFESADTLLHSDNDFHLYLQKWCEESSRAKDILTWQRCDPLDLRAQSRMGAWLGDCLYTEWLVRLEEAKPKVEFLAVGNNPYKKFTKAIDFCKMCDPAIGCDSPNNIGNLGICIPGQNLKHLRMTPPSVTPITPITTPPPPHTNKMKSFRNKLIANPGFIFLISQVFTWDGPRARAQPM